MYDDEKIEMRDVLVELTTDERQDRARQYVECDDRIEKLKAEQKSQNEKYKREIGALLNEKGNLSRAVQDGKEYREIECEWCENFEQKCWDLIRHDFDEDDEKRVVDQRTMTAEELQGNLEFDHSEQTDDEQSDDESESEDDQSDEDEYGDPEEPEYEPPATRGKKKAAKRGAPKKVAAKKSGRKSK